MTGTRIFSNTLYATFFIIMLAGCTTPPSDQTGKTALTPEQPQQEKADNSCSYFYFLWGNTAEYKDAYDEAFEAYEKALLCDPDADYIAEKLPLLLIRQSKFPEAEEWLNSYLTRHPEKNNMRLILANLLVLEEKTQQAKELYSQIVTAEPDNRQARLHLGLLCLTEGDLQGAEENYKAVIRHNSSSSFGHLYLARLYEKEKRFQEAEEEYQTVLKLAPSREILLETARFYNHTGQQEKAAGLYMEVLQEDETDEYAALGLSRTYLAQKNYRAALDELARIRQFTETPEKIDIVRANILINEDEFEKARELLTPLLLGEEADQANYLLGMGYFSIREYESALSALKRIDQNSSEFVNSVFLQCHILHETGRENEEIHLLNRLLSNTKTGRPIFYEMLAALYTDRGDTAVALAILQEGWQRYPENRELLYNYAYNLERTGHHDEAMQLMQRLLEIDPDNVRALNFVGYSWAEDNIHLPEALDYIRRASALEPDNPAILDSLGWVYYRIGDYEKASEALQKAAEMQQDDPCISEHLGDVYRKLNEQENALFYYRKALENQQAPVSEDALEEKIREITQ